MRSSWKLLPLAALMALGLLALLPDGPGRPRTASAAFVCTEGYTGTLRVDIIDDDTDARITVAGAVVKFTPNTQTGTSTDNVTDNSSEDNSTSVGRIKQNNVCSTTGSDTYEAELVSLPDALDDCDIIDDTDTGALDADTTTTPDLHADCSDVATSTPTTTALPRRPAPPPHNGPRCRRHRRVLFRKPELQQLLGDHGDRQGRRRQPAPERHPQRGR